jgi:hypothetical protein
MGANRRLLSDGVAVVRDKMGPGRTAASSAGHSCNDRTSNIRDQKVNKANKQPG